MPALSDYERVEKFDTQAMALVGALTEVVAGRPLDVVIDALLTVAVAAVANEVDLSDAEIIHEVRGASAFVHEALTEVVPPIRRERCKYVFYALHCALLATPAINMREGSE